MKWMRWMVLAIVLLTPSVSGAMNCQLAADITEASETRLIYLKGVREQVSSVVEKTTLAAEINALLDLWNESLDWQRKNCG